MIAKNLKAGKYSDGLIDYAFQGREEAHKDKVASVLRHSEDLLVPFSAADKEGIRELKHDFNERTIKYVRENPECKKSLIGHQVLSFTTDDVKQLGEAGVLKALDDYLILAGMQQTIFIAIRHEDTNNPHVHIIYHKVQNSMTKENDWQLNNKTVERGVALALRNRLTLVKDQKKVALTRGVLEIRAQDADIRQLREEHEVLKLARNLHHLSKIIDARGGKVEYMQEERVRINKDVFRQEDLHAIFYFNRMKALAGRKVGEQVLQTMQPNDELDRTKPTGRGISLGATEVADTIGEEMDVLDTQALRRKRRGKAYLLKHRGDQVKSHTKSEE
jgi:hypothetical protein